ncbi:MAG: SDR family oxidoreductase [Sphingobium sp.]|nr:SDR family oxidoreductase [Sphingobium sp.]
MLAIAFPEGRAVHDRLAGKVALITGAGQGIGAAIAAAMARQGATVLLLDRGEASVRVVADTIPGASAWPLDVTDEEGWADAERRIAQIHGRLDILVHNAGIEISGPIADMTFADWRGVMAVNVDAAFLGCRAMLPLLRASGSSRDAGASVIHLGSVAGLVGYPNQVGYNASKAAIRHLGRSLAIEWGRAGFNIRVNTIHPGPTRTKMVEEYVAAEAARGGDEAEIWKGISALSPLGRIGRVEDIAAGAVFLASDEAAFITGTDLIIDGGMTAQ